MKLPTKVRFGAGSAVVSGVAVVFTLAGSLLSCGGGKPSAEGSQLGSPAGSEGSGRPGANGSGGGGAAGGASGQPSGRPGGDRGSGGSGGGPGGFGGFGAQPRAALPVDVVLVERRRVAERIETQGTLEAEQEVDIVARIGGPITEIAAEEGGTVRQGQLLARIEDDEAKVQLELARVNVEETRLAFERAKVSLAAGIIPQQTYDEAKARFDSAAASVRSQELRLAFTVVAAPFAGRVLTRYVKQSEYVNVGTPLFRISDFDPLLCAIQIPEKDLLRVKRGQPARIRVEAFGDRTFDADVLRINPAIDSATGTMRVVLVVRGEGALRPGMFATVMLEVGAREDALVIPVEALVLESVGDAVYAVDGDRVTRRDLELGLRDGAWVEVRRGLSAGEQVVVVGQDALSDGMQIQVLQTRPPPTAFAAGPQPENSSPRERRSGAPGNSEADTPEVRTPEAMAGRPAGGPPSGAAPGGTAAGGAGGRFPGGFPSIDWNDKAQVEQVKTRMRERGLSDSQIEERLKMMRERSTNPPGGAPPAGR